MNMYREIGKSFINELCVIHVYEADLALLLGSKWKEAIVHAQKKRTIIMVNMVGYCDEIECK